MTPNDANGSARTRNRVVTTTASASRESPPCSSTWTESPGLNLERSKNTPGPSTRESTWPAINADPGSPGDGPKRYHPTLATFPGTSRAPLLSTPNRMTGASTPMPGMVSWTGRGDGTWSRCASRAERTTIAATAPVGVGRATSRPRRLDPAHGGVPTSVSGRVDKTTKGVATNTDALTTISHADRPLE